MNIADNENGGAFLELLLISLLLLIFTLGAREVHCSLQRRFERIVTERNHTIESIRNR